MVNFYHVSFFSCATLIKIARAYFVSISGVEKTLQSEVYSDFIAEIKKKLSLVSRKLCKMGKSRNTVSRAYSITISESRKLCKKRSLFWFHCKNQENCLQSRENSAKSEVYSDFIAATEKNRLRSWENSAKVYSDFIAEIKKTPIQRIFRLHLRSQENFAKVKPILISSQKSKENCP